MKLAAERLPAGTSAVRLLEALETEALEIFEQDRRLCRAIGEHGAELIGPHSRVLTHCNAGALATAGIGTALAAIYVAQEQGKIPSVFVDETRPLLQGSRLTAWELTRAGIETTYQWYQDSLVGSVRA